MDVSLPDYCMRHSHGMWRRAFVAWLLIVLVESVLGTMRELFLKPVVGDAAANRFGFVTGSLSIVVLAWLTAPWVKASRQAQLSVGAVWMLMMLAFELAIGHAQGYSMQRIRTEFDPSQGGLMGIGLLITMLAPALGAEMHDMKRLQKLL